MCGAVSDLLRTPIWSASRRITVNLSRGRAVRFFTEATSFPPSVCSGENSPPASLHVDPSAHVRPAIKLSVTSWRHHRHVFGVPMTIISSLFHLPRRLHAPTILFPCSCCASIPSYGIGQDEVRLISARASFCMTTGLFRHVASAAIRPVGTHHRRGFTWRWGSACSGRGGIVIGTSCGQRHRRTHELGIRKAVGAAEPILINFVESAGCRRSAGCGVPGHGHRRRVRTVSPCPC